MVKFNEKKYIYIGACVCVIVICIIVCLFIESNNSRDEISYIENTEIVSEASRNSVDIEKKQKIIIHIAGEVCSPGIVEVEDGSRVQDIINMAGGLTDYADTSNVNLAYQVQDGQKIVIPNINSGNQDANSIIENDSSFVVSDNTKDNEKININTATQSELELLSGIGPSTASKIIEYRKDNGKFSKIEDIKNVPGIGNSKYNEIKDEICVK